MTRPPQASRPPFPNWLLGGIGTLMVLSIVLAAGRRPTGEAQASEGASATVVASRDLRFEDRADGSIAIIEAGSRSAVETVAPGSNGFLRGALRGLVRERRQAGIGPEAAFRLIGRADGHLLLHDPATGRTLDLGAFGPTNAAVFARLLGAPSVPGPLAASTVSRSTPTP